MCVSVLYSAVFPVLFVKLPQHITSCIAKTSLRYACMFVCLHWGRPQLLNVATAVVCTCSSHSQVGLRGFRRTPPKPCNLVKLKIYFLNAETAAVQLQSFNRAVVVLLQTAYKPSCSCYTAINTACK